MIVDQHVAHERVLYEEYLRQMAAGAFSLEKLSDTYLLFLPLMFFPEAVLNGWLVSIMVGFRPHWIGSFRDEEYLHGK